MKYFILCFLSLAHAAPPANIADRMRQAGAEYRAMHFDKVIELLNPYTEQLEKTGLMALASSYSYKGQFAEEVRVLKILVSKNEEDYASQMLLGQGYMKQAMLLTKPGDYNQRTELQVLATQAFRATLKLRKHFKPAYDELLTLLLEQKDHNDARELLVEGLEAYGKRPELVKELCRLNSLDGFVQAAITTCRDAMQMAPGFPDTYVYLVQSLTDQGETTQAEALIVAAATKFLSSEFVQWAAGTVFYKKVNYPVATKYFSQAVKADPLSARSQFGYAQSLYEDHHEEDSLPVYKTACHLDSSIAMEPLFAAAARLRQKNPILAARFKEAANSCHR